MKKPCTSCVAKDELIAAQRALIEQLTRPALVLTPPRSWTFPGYPTIASSSNAAENVYYMDVPDDAAAYEEGLVWKTTCTVEVA